MDLRDYVRVLRKSWALILAVTVVGIALGLGLTLATTKVYQASTQVFVTYSPEATSDATNPGQINQFLQQQVQSYISLATAPDVVNAVRTKLSIKDSVQTEQQLAGHISADAPTDKVLINLHVTDTDPAKAAAKANALATAFNAKVENTAQVGSKSVVKLSTIQPAIVPSSPITPNKILNIGLGLVLGLFIGIGVAITREVLDNTVKSARDFEELGIPLLAQVAFDKRASRNVIAFRGDAHSARSEAYRQLRTNLQFVDVDNPPRIIAVTSAVPGEGKSTTAINLAASLAEAGARVCLIEADLRRPSIAKALGLVSDVGFTTAVIGKAPVESVLQNAGRNLAVLTCGPIPPNPSELLISRHARQVIADIAAKVDFTIIDTPPLLPVTDGAEIATIADATILVHRAAKTTRDQAARSLEALAKVGKRPVGVILNMVTRGGGGRYDYDYGYYYAAYRPNANPGDSDAKGNTSGAPKGGTATKALPTATTATESRTSDISFDRAMTPAVAEPDAASAPTPDDTPQGRRARHRNRRAAAAAPTAAAAPAAAAPGAAGAPDVADTDAFAPVGLNGRAQHPAEDVTDDAPTDVAEDEVGPEPFVYDTDAFEDDDYPPFDPAEDDAEPRIVPASDDVTQEFAPIDGQESLPLDDEAAQRRDLDKALGVHADDRR